MNKVDLWLYTEKTKPFLNEGYKCTCGYHVTKDDHARIITLDREQVCLYCLASAFNDYHEKHKKFDSRAYLCGIKDYGAGLSLMDNPYDYDSICHDRWMHGWNDALDIRSNYEG